MAMNRIAAAAGVVIAGLSASSRAATPYDDNFNSKTTGSQWSVMNDDAAALSLSQLSGSRLDLISTGGGLPNNDALYLSQYRLSTAANFSIQVDYSIDRTLIGPHSNGANGDSVGLVFGVGRDLPDGTDSAAIGVGLTNIANYDILASTVSYRVNDITPAGANLPLETNTLISGTLAVEYIAATDSLTLRRLDQANQPSFSYTLPAGTVRGTKPGGWNASELVVGLGGRGSGLTISAERMYFDNFAITQGSIVPEPSGLAVLIGCGWFGSRRQRKSS